MPEKPKITLIEPSEEEIRRWQERGYEVEIITEEEYQRRVEEYERIAQQELERQRKLREAEEKARRAEEVQKVVESKKPRSFWEGIKKSLKDFFTWFFFLLPLRAYRRVIATTLSTGFMWSFHALNKLFPEQARWLANKISELYFVDLGEWGPFIQKYIEQLTGKTIDLNLIRMRKGVFAQREVFQALGREFLEPMLGLIMPEGKLTPEKGMRSCQRFLATNLQFQMSAWLLHMLGDICSFGMFKSMKDLPNAIAWTYGIGWLSWLAMGPFFHTGIADPIQEGLNKTYRPKKPSLLQAIDMYHKGILDLEEVYEIGAAYGFEDEFIAGFLALQEKDVPDSALDDLLRWGVIDDKLLEEFLKQKGYSGENLELYKTYISQRRKYKIIEDIAETAKRLYEKGKISKEELIEYLKEANYTDEEIILTLDLLNLKKLL